jgi:hypothetical protein
MRIPSFCILFALAGCTWVSKQDVDARTPSLDDDGDGYPKDIDCDDDNKNTHPEADETWYDGIDQDCLQDDDYDSDQDGFVADKYFGLTTDGIKGTGFLSGGDCNDQDSAINPASVDIWYDGIDTDCGGDDDYDQDLDGWAPKTVPYGPTLYAPGTGVLGIGDCDDTEVAVNPGVADAWYDGVDSDCQGDDDFDADGDGHFRLGYPYSATQYAEESTGTLPGGDCDDAVAEVNPAQVEIWYDGIDSDCAGDDDFDADGDGYFKHDETYGPTTYVDDAPELPGGDCNDDPTDNGTASNPGEIEILLNSTDHDCDEIDGGFGAHSFRLDLIEGTSFLGVKGFAIGENSSQIWLAAAADSYTAPFGSGEFCTWAYALDASDPTGTPPEGRSLLCGSTAYELLPGLDLLVDEELIFGAMGFRTMADGSLVPKRFVHVGGPTPGVVKSSLAMTSFFGRTTPWPAFSDFDMSRADTGSPLHLVGCDDDPDGEILNYNHATRDSMMLDISGTAGGWVAESEANFLGFSASVCSVHGFDAGATVYSNKDGVFQVHTIDPAALTLTEVTLPGADTGSMDTGLSGTSGVAELSPIDIVIPARATDGWAVILDGTSGGIVIMRPDYSLASVVNIEGTATQISAVFGPDGTLFLAYRLDTGEAFISWGSPEAGLILPIPVFSTFGIAEIEIWIDASTGDHLILGVTGTEDQVAYGIARVNGD